MKTSLVIDNKRDNFIIGNSDRFLLVCDMAVQPHVEIKLTCAANASYDSHASV